MPGRKLRIAAVLLALLTPLASHAAGTQKAFSLPELASGQANNVTVARVRQDGRPGIEIRASNAGPDGDSFLTLVGYEFQDGEISADVSAEVLPGSDSSIRAFAGLGFRGSADGYEAFYLRMLNGRATDQLQRNHAAQYISHPGYGWARLRREMPGAYEAYVDLQPRRWTPMRIVVCGAEAALYVNGASQPTLLVHDLKRGAQTRGALLLWVGPGTAARFANVKVRTSVPCPLGAAR